MADGILAAVNENGNIDRFIDTKGGVHYIEPKRYEESVAKIDAAATKAKETVNSATEAVSECKAQTGACTQETARAKEIADTVESRITGIEGDVAALRDSVSQDIRYAHISWKVPYSDSTIQFDRIGNIVICHGNVKFTSSGQCNYSTASEILPKGFRPLQANTPAVFSFASNFALLFDENGKVTMLGNTNSAYACCTGSWVTGDPFPD